MSRATKSEEASVGYKIKVGDYIVATTPFNLIKTYQVTSVTLKIATVKLKGRHDIHFPRIYSLPFMPIQSKPSKYEPMNKWTVRINDTIVKRRLKL